MTLMAVDLPEFERPAEGDFAAGIRGQADSPRPHSSRISHGGRSTWPPLGRKLLTLVYNLELAAVHISMGCLWGGDHEAALDSLNNNFRRDRQ